VIRKLAEGEKLLGEGKSLEEVVRHLEITESTWHRWRNQYGGMKADDAKKLKELERENARLKRIVADQALDIDMLKEVNRGNFGPRTAAGRPLWPSKSSSGSLSAGPVASWANPAPPSFSPRPSRVTTSWPYEPSCGTSLGVVPAGAG